MQHYNQHGSKVVSRQNRLKEKLQEKLQKVFKGVIHYGLWRRRSEKRDTRPVLEA